MKIKKLTSLVLAGVTMASVTLTGCGNKIDADAVVATLDGADITLGLANFMAQYQAVTYDSYYMSMAGEDMWSSDLYGDGSTLTDDVKSNVIDTIETNYLLEEHMEDYNVEITDDDLATINTAAEQFMSDNSDDAIATMGATKENVAEMLRLDLIQTKMKAAIEAEVDTEVSDEEAAQRTFSYIKISTDGYTDDDDNYVEYTDDEVAALADTAAEVASAAATDFDAAAETYGYDVSTYSYGSDESSSDDDDTSTDSSSMDTAVITAADALSEGQVSPLITTEDAGYYIIRLDSEFDEDATATKKEEIVSTRQLDHYTEITDGYKTDAEWTLNDDVWEAVNFDQLYSIISNENTETEEVSGTE